MTGGSMKKKRFTEEQIVKALKRWQAGETVAVVARDLGVHEQTLYNWKSKYGGLEVSELAELKRLRDENNRLKKLVADQALDITMLKDINSRKW
jgi:putative transposase